MHDELLGIEIHGTPRTAHSDPNAVHYDDGCWIMAEEVQPPSVWSTAFDLVEECAMTSLQQAVLKMLAMEIHDEGLSVSARDRNLCRCLGDGFGTADIQRFSHLGIRTVVKLANMVAARIRRSLMVPYLVGHHRNPVQNYRSDGSGSHRGVAPVSWRWEIGWCVWEALAGYPPEWRPSGRLPEVTRGPPALGPAGAAA